MRAVYSAECSWARQRNDRIRLISVCMRRGRTQQLHTISIRAVYSSDCNSTLRINQCIRLVLFLHAKWPHTILIRAVCSSDGNWALRTSECIRLVPVLHAAWPHTILIRAVCSSDYSWALRTSERIRLVSVCVRRGRIQYELELSIALIAFQHCESVSASEWYLCACGVATYNIN